jgi:hypothetical protein
MGCNNQGASLGVSTVESQETNGFDLRHVFLKVRFKDTVQATKHDGLKSK